MKILAVMTALFLGGCEAAKDFGALAYCVIHQNDSNRRCN